MSGHKVHKQQDLNFVAKNNILLKAIEWIVLNLIQDQRYYKKSLKKPH